MDLMDKIELIIRLQIFNLINKANNLNYLVIVITNQAGIGKGFYSEEEFKKLN